jgi:hypothetical protein
MTAGMMLEVPAFGTETPIRLLWEEAPRTCAAVWDALPVRKPAFHARRSGKELFVLADPFANPGAENLRMRLAAGDVLFIHFPPTWSDDHEDFTRSDAGLFDIAVIYGADALLRGPEGPVEGNLFGRIPDERQAEFAALCQRMWLEGLEEVVLRGVGGPA